MSISESYGRIGMKLGSCVSDVIRTAFCQCGRGMCLFVCLSFLPVWFIGLDVGA